MKDAGIEAKRGLASPSAQLNTNFGPYAAAVDEALAEADRERVIDRIWSKDASLWKADPSHQKIINNSLGWLTITSSMLESADQVKSFAQRIRATGDFRHVMVCGMGGSSLCPEVLRQTFGPQHDFPELLVLDSTDPDVIHAFGQQIDVERCLFIIASKSGTTTEPIAFHKYWYKEVSTRTDNPGRSFVAITDPGTLMSETAAAQNFNRVFLNPADIGGRYSALSYFGMVPAALMGLDIVQLLQRGEAMSSACRTPPRQNPAALLGAAIAECAAAGRDKLTILTDEKISSLGLWIEQLIAESTGKEGKGVVPIVGEPIRTNYGDDRFFVSIAVGALEKQTRAKLDELSAAGQPVVYRTLVDLNDLGAEFFLWEMATAFAGWRLRINPFDQPNVQESKDATKSLLEQYTREGTLPEQESIAADGTVTIYAGNGDTRSNRSVQGALAAHMAKIVSHDYVAMLAYVEQTPPIDEALQRIRQLIGDATQCATTVGYGPRFLHSTGQLHKGGPNNGVFIQLTAKDSVDFAVPDSPYTFSVLKEAQAQGDFQSLLAHGRRAIRVDLGIDVEAGLKHLTDLLSRIFSQT